MPWDREGAPGITVEIELNFVTTHHQTTYWVSLSTLKLNTWFNCRVGKFIKSSLLPLKIGQQRVWECLEGHHEGVALMPADGHTFEGCF